GRSDSTATRPSGAGPEVLTKASKPDSPMMIVASVAARARFWCQASRRPPSGEVLGPCRHVHHQPPDRLGGRRQRTAAPNSPGWNMTKSN
ncbi:hypothetical protein PPH41_05605, partial [Burkholderia gladioli]|nr:hypothetical protein [Burkholderia gladioli]